MFNGIIDSQITESGNLTEEIKKIGHKVVPSLLPASWWYCRAGGVNECNPYLQQKKM